MTGLRVNSLWAIGITKFSIQHWKKSVSHGSFIILHLPLPSHPLVYSFMYFCIYDCAAIVPCSQPSRPFKDLALILAQHCWSCRSSPGSRVRTVRGRITHEGGWMHASKMNNTRWLSGYPCMKILRYPFNFILCSWKLKFLAHNSSPHHSRFIERTGAHMPSISSGLWLK